MYKLTANIGICISLPRNDLYCGCATIILSYLLQLLWKETRRGGGVVIGSGITMVGHTHQTANQPKTEILKLQILRGRSVAPPLRIWRLHIVTEPELKYEYEGVVR